MDTLPAFDVAVVGVGMGAVVATIALLILGALTFFPALVLGPIAEHVSMLGGQTF